ncbi:MAG: FxsA family protein [Bacteriovoracaceae bacterium]
MFTLIPALELYLLFQVGGQIGALNTILIIIVTGVVGAALAKSQGLELLIKIQNKLNQGEIPAGQLLQGFLVMGGGLLLLTPGFVTDVLGFAMVLPGTRAILAALIRKIFSKSVASGNIHVFTNFKSYQDRSQGERPFQGQGRMDSDTFEAEYQKKDED